LLVDVRRPHRRCDLQRLLLIGACSPSLAGGGQGGRGYPARRSRSRRCGCGW
jgi:hypothetical protein